jgi:RNA polymerase sigma-70 factor (sigma-E family)
VEVAMADHGQSSFHDFVEARIATLSRVAFLLSGDAHLAEDLVQQTLIKVASRWERLVAQGDPEPYVRRVLYHNHISWWRRHRREAMPLAQLPEQARPDHAAGVDTALTLGAALASLAPRQRAVLVLRFYEDLSEQQTATALGCSVNTVKSQTRDALRRMRTLVQDLQEASR